jgi:hypothetical protein
MYSVVKGQFRCPKCRRNVNEIVRVNKYTHGFPHVCALCATQGVTHVRLQHHPSAQ